VHSSAEIAQMLGVSSRYVRKVQKKHSFPRLHRGSQAGSKNHQYKFGRMIDLDGYVLLKNKNGRLSEHRHLMQEKLGRDLATNEVVDHIDGLTLNNDILNLRLFHSNAEHLKVTISGKSHHISVSGMKNIKNQSALIPVDTYRLRKKRGDVRLHAILRAALQLGITSPFLLSSHQWLEKAQIDPYSRQSLLLGLQALSHRYKQDLLL